MTAAELRQAVADVRDQLDREPAVLDTLSEAILAGDLGTVRGILVHLRDFVTVLQALVRLIHVTDEVQRG
jgi:hypothetical protein